MSSDLEYRLLDAGDQKKVELFGKYKLIRPCPQAIWPIKNPEMWSKADGEFIRTSKEKGVWKSLSSKNLPHDWIIKSPSGYSWYIEPNDFGNLGVFTEHWTYSEGLENWFDKNGRILNLFTYSGSNCVNLVAKGYKVTAVDSSKNAMNNYTKNLDLNKLSREGQRLILEDVYKFIAREQRRGSKYDGIMIDAPSYGRGTKGEVFKIDDHLVKLITTCKDLLGQDGKMVLTLHSPRFTPIILENLMKSLFTDKEVFTTEILNMCESGVSLPSGFLVKIG